MAKREPISTIDMPHEAWLNSRKSGIGGSDAAAVLGLSKWRTPIDVWEDKLGMAPPIEDNERMMMGRMLEPIVAQRYKDVSGRDVQNDNKIRFHPEHDFLLCNMDRLIQDNGDGMGPGILEIKTTSGYAFESWESEVPLEYYCQLMHYLSVTGYRWGEFAVLVDGCQFERLPVLRDDEFIAKMTKEHIDWWNEHIVNNHKPLMTGEETLAAKALIGSSIEATPEILTAYNDLRSVKDRLKVVSDRKDELSNEIREFMQDTESLTCGADLLATYKSSSGIDSVQLHKDHPDVFEKHSERKLKVTDFKKAEPMLAKAYTKPGAGSRRFLVKEPK